MPIDEKIFNTKLDDLEQCEEKGQTKCGSAVNLCSSVCEKLGKVTPTKSKVFYSVIVV
jgi:hypothetical protein